MVIFCWLPGAGGWHGGPGPVCDGLYLSAANSPRFSHEVLWGIGAALRLVGPRVVRCAACVFRAEWPLNTPARENHKFGELHFALLFRDLGTMNTHTFRTLGQLCLVWPFGRSEWSSSAWVHKGELRACKLHL